MFKLFFTFIFIIQLILPSISMANECNESAQEIKKGQISNCDGILLSPKAARQADEAMEDVVYYKKLNDKLYLRQSYIDKEVNLLDQRLQLYMTQSQILAEEVYKKENQDKWQKVVYFSLGILASGIAVYGTAHLNK
jgi:hypothetical protein